MAPEVRIPTGRITHVYTIGLMCGNSGGSDQICERAGNVACQVFDFRSEQQDIRKVPAVALRHIIGEGCNRTRMSISSEFSGIVGPAWQSQIYG